MPGNTDPPGTAPEWWRAVQAAQQARHRTIDDLIAHAEAHRPERITPLEVAAHAFEHPPSKAQDDDQ